jgi:hypothetical protein
MPYDSTADTLRHIARVQELLTAFAAELIRRGEVHDQSKLGPMEKPARDANPPDYDRRFGEPFHVSDQEWAAFNHHVSINSHHPEHFGDRGVSGMDLLDLIEMFFDWKAAGEPYRHDTFAASVDINRKRYNLDPQIVAIFTNTAKRLGWM